VRLLRLRVVWTYASNNHRVSESLLVTANRGPHVVGACRVYVADGPADAAPSPNSTAACSCYSIIGSSATTA
jgi:hypothetical protein